MSSMFWFGINEKGVKMIGGRSLIELWAMGKPVGLELRRKPVGLGRMGMLGNPPVMRERQRWGDGKSLRKAEKHRERKMRMHRAPQEGKDDLFLVYCVFMALR